MLDASLTDIDMLATLGRSVMERHVSVIDIKGTLGFAAGLLSICAFAPYIRSMLRGQTQPQRACWLIWSVLGCISLASQVSGGATSSLWFAGIQVGGTVAVLVLSIWCGTGRFLVRGDRYVLLAAAIGLGMWVFTHTPAYALGISISISLMGGCMTIRAAYLAPQSEPLGSWSMALAASVLAVLAVGRLDWLLLAYPLYLLGLYGGIVIAVLAGRAHSVVHVPAQKRPAITREAL